VLTHVYRDGADESSPCHPFPSPVSRVTTSGWPLPSAVFRPTKDDKYV